MSSTAPHPLNGAADHPLDHGAIPRLGRAVLHHRRRVMLIWLVIFIAGMAGAGTVSDRLKVDFSLPGQPGYETAKKVQDIYGSGLGQPPSILVVTAPEGAKIDSARTAAAFNKLRGERPGLRIVDAGATGDAAFATKDGRSTFALLYGPPG